MKITSLLLTLLALPVARPAVGQQTLVAIFAHPDDERIVAPIMARYAREGHKVVLVVATDGRKGVTAHAKIPAGDSLVVIRNAETRCATRELNISDPILLGHEDAGLASFAALGRLRDDVARILHELKPDAVITFGREGGTGHPDHRLVGDVVTEVVQASAESSPLFYPGLPIERMTDAPPARPTVKSTAERHLNVRVPYSAADFAAAQRAYACHRSQYTAEQVAANMRYIHHAFRGQVFLRHWNGGAARTELLERSTQTGQRVNINGMQMYYEVSGTGEPLVVLHGAYMNIPTMGAIIPKLAQTHRVYAVELQGHDRTTDIDRPITYQNLADDVAAFMDALGLQKADVFGYSMGAAAGLQLAIRHPAKVSKLVAASVAYDAEGWQPEFRAFIPQMTVEMFLAMPWAQEHRKRLANPAGFPELVRKLIALEKEPMAWEADVRKLKAPVLIITGDADVATLEHSVALFRLLGGGVMGDMGKPLPASRLAVLPATSHTAVITQTDLLHALIEPFLKGETPKSMFESGN